MLLGIGVATQVAPRLPDRLDLASAPLVVAGVVLLGAATAALGRGLTPLPRPREQSAVVERGPYRHARHPMYTGVFLLFLGIALATTWAALALTLALAVVFDLKSRVEERLLGQRFAAYRPYRERVRRRFVPGLY